MRLVEMKALGIGNAFHHKQQESRECGDQQKVAYSVSILEF